DFVLNYPFIFEVVEPEDIELPQRQAEAADRERQRITLRPPDPAAPAVCVIDSGIQEEHFLLEPAIDRDLSFCFLPGVSSKDIGDFVRPGGHGTRVAGAVLYRESVPREGEHQLAFWVQNARVLNADCKMPLDLFPALAIRAAVEKFHQSPRRT